MNEMHTVTVFWKQPTQPIRLAFKTLDAATECRKEIETRDYGMDGSRPSFFVADEFGNHLTGRKDQVAYILQTDLEREAEINIGIAIIQAKAQMKANKLAESDPELRAAAAGQQFRQQLMNGAGRPM